MISGAGDAVVESRSVGLAEVAVAVAFVAAAVAVAVVVGGGGVVDVVAAAAAAEGMLATPVVVDAVALKFQTRALETSVRPGSFQVAASSCWVEDFGLD